jgi:O-acetyl-ADP-ribose deacetylase (regulator of RNase III)
MATVLRAIEGDITKLEVDAIVNAANPSLMGGGGVDGAIHRQGGASIRAECQKIVVERGPLPTGQAVITGAGALPARHVIHTVGPIWSETGPAEGVELLASCYRHSLDLAAEHGCRTVAFPCISTGAYGFPTDLAADTAIEAVREWVARHPGAVEEVTFVCFDQANLDLYRAGLASGGQRARGE